MKLVKILKIAFGMVKSNKLRSWLTIIGIIIGIASVITIITAGEYFQEKVTETLEGMGGDAITIVPTIPFKVIQEENAGDNSGKNSMKSSGGGSGMSIDTTTETVDESNNNSGYTEPELITQPELTKTDVSTLLRIPSVEYVNVNVEESAELQYGDARTNVRIKGVDPNVWPKMTNKKIKQGRMLKSGDKAVAVISNELSNSTFKREVGLNQLILLNGRSYRVVGILDNDGGLLGGLGGLFGSSVYIPYKEVYSLLYDVDDVPEMEQENYTSIEIQLNRKADYDLALKEIESRLMLSRKVTKDAQNFYVNSPRTVIEGTRSLINGLTAFLAFIASISLLVGSTGIANTMFTSVLEKTKEIGIMKAIGAKNSDIMFIFLCNAAMISLVGGIIGIIIGIIAVQVILFLISTHLKVPFEFTLSLRGTVIATLVSIIVGLLAGLVPAKNAAELKPVDALRYE
jgi:putative ABC transport system permease protein